MSNKFYTYLQNDKPSNLVFLKIYSAKIDDIIMSFTDQEHYN